MGQSPTSFSYEEMTGRNLGFVSADEQAKLRAASVFICGVGGMGSARVIALARAGIGRLTLSACDCFDLSNLNRQFFATLATVGRDKAEATSAACRAINADIEIE